MITQCRRVLQNLSATIYGLKLIRLISLILIPFKAGSLGALFYFLQYGTNLIRTRNFERTNIPNFYSINNYKPGKGTKPAGLNIISLMN